MGIEWNDDTIAVVHPGVSLSKGSVAMFSLYGDQPFGKGWRTNSTRRRMGVSGDSYPELLRNVAQIMEDENLENLGELATFLERAHEEAQLRMSSGG